MHMEESATTDDNTVWMKADVWDAREWTQDTPCGVFLNEEEGLSEIHVGRFPGNTDFQNSPPP